MNFRWISGLCRASGDRPAELMPIASEARCRRADFSEGVPVVLSNGEAWQVPRPIMEFRLEMSATGLGFRESSRFGDGRSRDFGDAYWGLCQAVHASEPGLDRLNAYAMLAVDLLRRNYALDDAHIVALLPYVQGDEANATMWSSLIEVALGIGPKPPAAGDDSSSSPAAA